MDNILEHVLNWKFALSFVLLALAIAALTFVLRKVIEFALDSSKIPTGNMSKTSRVWTEVVLPISPIVLGGLIGLVATMYPFPEGLTTTSARVLFGLVAGFLSGLVYRLVKRVLVNKLTAFANGTEAKNAQCEECSVSNSEVEVKETINKQ